MSVTNTDMNNTSVNLETISKGVKYYYTHREQILEQKREKRYEKLMQDAEYLARLEKREKNKAEKDAKKLEREKLRKAKRDAVLASKTGSPLVIPGTESI